MAERDVARFKRAKEKGPTGYARAGSRRKVHMPGTRIAIIGGSGLYDIDGFLDKKSIKMDTPFGEPSDAFIAGRLHNKEIVFLPRHGKSHSISPSHVNYRANIYALKKMNVTRIISVSACGSLKEELKPLDFVIPSQFIDRTGGKRLDTFFDEDLVAHVGFAEPVCGALTQALYNAGKKLGLGMHLGGTYVNMEGPAFSTKAESNLYRSWNADIIGMTNLTEAKLAREAEICYATLASITDYDCWYDKAESVSVDAIIHNLNMSVQNAKKIIKEVIPAMAEYEDCPCRRSLKDAMVTPLGAVSEKTKVKLRLLLKKYEK